MVQQPNSGKTLGNLTFSELEELIERIVQKSIQDKAIAPNTVTQPIATSEARQKNIAFQTFEETFDNWEDDRTDEEIIEQIYGRC